jgi:phosphonate transport system ATP-binding protein
MREISRNSLSSGNADFSRDGKQVWCSLAGTDIRRGDATVIHDLSLTLYSGEKVMVLGNSGAGKSTLLNYLFKHTHEKDSVLSRSALIPQELGLIENLSVFHNVFMGRLDQYNWAYNLLNLIFPQSLQRQQISAQLSLLGLDDFLFRAVAQLSGGQQQRVAIARALYRGGDLLFADEPVANLERPMAEKVLGLLTQGFQGCVISLHDTALALAFADRIIGLKDGRVVVDKPVGQIDAAQLFSLYQ